MLLIYSGLHKCVNLYCMRPSPPKHVDDSTALQQMVLEEEGNIDDGAPANGEQLLGLDPRLAMELDLEAGREGDEEEDDGEDEDGIEVYPVATLKLLFNIALEPCMLLDL